MRKWIFALIPVLLIFAMQPGSAFAATEMPLGTFYGVYSTQQGITGMQDASGKIKQLSQWEEVLEMTFAKKTISGDPSYDRTTFEISVTGSDISGLRTEKLNGSWSYKPSYKFLGSFWVEVNNYNGSPKLIYLQSVVTKDKKGEHTQILL